MGLYLLARGIKVKNIILTAMSLLFYAWGEPVWVCLLIFSALVDYINGRVIGRWRGKWQAKAALVSSLVINLTLLAVFKYLDFFLGSVGLLLRVTNVPVAGIALPIGISFYTFQTLSYTLDVYKDEVRVQRSFLDFILFVSLFPQLIAGPILRYSELESQLRDRVITWNGCARGIVRFTAGLGKKVLIANTAGAIAARVLDGDLSALPALEALTGIVFFTAQIYFDFSGYSDMAIGLGYMFGFDYSENFRYPYQSRSITAFWRRWHISLGSFFRDYVYIPLGGNRKHQILNLFITWGLTGLWHGASWNFVLWGLYYFALLVAEKFLISRLGEKTRSILGAVYTLPLVVIGWAIFYFTDFSRIGGFFASLFGSHGFAGGGTFALIAGNLPLLALCAIASTAAPKNLAVRLERRLKEPVRIALNLAFSMGMLALCTVLLAGQSYNPFLYFRF